MRGSDATESKVQSPRSKGQSVRCNRVAGVERSSPPVGRMGAAGAVGTGTVGTGFAVSGDAGAALAGGSNVGITGVDFVRAASRASGVPPRPVPRTAG